MSSLRFLQEDIMPPASLFFMALKFWIATPLWLASRQPSNFPPLSPTNLLLYQFTTAIIIHIILSSTGTLSILLDHCWTTILYSLFYVVLFFSPKTAFTK